MTDFVPLSHRSPDAPKQHGQQGCRNWEQDVPRQETTKNDHIADVQSVADNARDAYDTVYDEEPSDRTLQFSFGEDGCDEKGGKAHKAVSESFESYEDRVGVCPDE